MTSAKASPAEQPADRSDRAVVLAVGLGAPPPRLEGPWAAATIRHVAWNDLTAALLARLQPVAVLAPLCGADFDAVELAERLSDCGFGGGLLVAVPPLPDPALVRREIAAAAPGLAVVLLAPE